MAPTTLDISTGALSTETEVPAQRALDLLPHEVIRLAGIEAPARVTWLEANRAEIEAAGRLPGQHPSPEGFPQPEPVEGWDDEEAADGLGSLTKAQLLEVADAEGVEAWSSWSKDAIRSAIRESRGLVIERAEDGPDEADG